MATGRLVTWEAEIAEALTCSICYQPYTEVERIPLVLQCGHSICKVCLGHIDRLGKKCPSCNKLYTGSAITLPRNYSLLNILGIALRRAEVVRAALSLRLFDACRDGDEQGLDAVLEEVWMAGGEAGAAAVTALVNSQNREGYTCLIVAIDARHVRIVERLCRVPGLDANLGRIRGGDSVLMCATKNGHIETVQALLAVPGIDVNARTYKLWSALILAACEGHTKTVQALLAVPGINFNARNSIGSSALILAAYNGHTGVVQVLLVVPGIDVNARNKNGNSALILAASNGHITIVQTLLAFPGLNVNARNNRGDSALDSA